MYFQAFLFGGYKQLRVQSGIEPVHPPVQVRSGYPPGGTHLGNDVPLPYPRADIDEYPLQMQKRRGEAMAMVEDEGTPGKKHIRMGQGDDPVRRGPDRGSFRGRDIEAVVGALGLAIQYPLASVNARDPPLDRTDETLRKIDSGIIQAPRGLDLSSFGPDPG